MPRSDSLGDCLSIPARLNQTMAGGFLALNAVQFLVLPLALLPIDRGFGFLLVPFALATTPLWALIHEAFHGTLHPDPGTNRFLGRALSICFGSPFRLLRFGHLQHHRLNRAPEDRTEIYDPQGRGRFAATALFYFRLLQGLYLGELLANLLVLLPRAVLFRVTQYLFADGAENARIDSSLRHLLSADRLREIRIDALLILALLGASAWAYGDHWPMLVAALALRGLLVSILDNAFHYGTGLDDRASGLNLALPPLASRMLLHFNLHGAHHRYPHLHWAALPLAFQAVGGRHDGAFLPAVIRQLRGPLPIVTRK